MPVSTQARGQSLPCTSCTMQPAPPGARMYPAGCSPDALGANEDCAPVHRGMRAHHCVRPPRLRRRPCHVHEPLLLGHPLGALLGVLVPVRLAAGARQKAPEVLCDTQHQLTRMPSTSCRIADVKQGKPTCKESCLYRDCKPRGIIPLGLHRGYSKPQAGLCM